MAARKGANRFPRPGQRIAPATLRDALTERAPKRLVGGAGTLRLCDLDEQVWDGLDPKAIGELAEIVVDRVAAACVRKAVHDRHFPRPPRGTRLADLGLEHRTLLCLAREGFDEDPGRLGEQTIGQILAIRAFGPRCLVDLLTALETRLSEEPGLCGELTAEAQRLAAVPEAPSARSDDPRFGPLIQAVDVDARSAGELAGRLLDRGEDPPDPLYAAGQVRQLRERIAALPTLTLEEELIGIFAATPHQRNQQIAIGYYGWGDGQPHTLAEIGARYGMTRERTRQICAKLVRRKNPAAIPAPVMDRALAFLKHRLPCHVDRLEEEMAGAGLTSIGLRLENVAAGAGLLGRAVSFRIVRVETGRLAVRPHQAELPGVAVELGKKQVYYHGVATVGQIDEALAQRLGGRPCPALVAEALQLIEGFRWLDRPGGWFRLLSIAKHGLPKAVDKVLAIAGRLSVEELRAAVGRNRRMWKVPPPENVLLEFCRQTPGVRVEGKQIIADSPRRWKRALTGVEARLVAILKKHGPVMERGALEDLCVAGGMNRFSFHAFIACSPVIAQYGHSVYGLLKAKVSPQSVKSLIAKRRAQRDPSRVLQAHGRTGDGRVWLSYRLSKAASTYAVITVPAALKDVVCGRFALLTPDGRRVGTLAAKDGRAWGLGAFLRRHGARIDDRLRLTIDLDKREALIALGDQPADEDAS